MILQQEKALINVTHVMAAFKKSQDKIRTGASCLHTITALELRCSRILNTERNNDRIMELEAHNATTAALNDRTSS